MAKQANRVSSDDNETYDFADIDGFNDVDYYEGLLSNKSRLRERRRKAVKHRLEDYFDRRELNKRNSYYDDASND